MRSVTIYTGAFCGYCQMAKRLLDQKDISYSEISITQTPHKRAEMIQRADGHHTVPQIFVGETHIGGCDDLYALEQSGKLDQVLAR